MKILLVVALLACAQSTAGAQTAGNMPPHMPYVVDHACPGEGCSLGYWLACRDLSLRSAPRTNSPVVLRLHHGQKLLATAAQVTIERPGIVVFSDTLCVGKSEEPLTSENSTLMGPQDTAFLLDYLGEGQWHWWRNGRIDEVYLPWSAVARQDPVNAARTYAGSKAVTWSRNRR
jgi:hypothetical protein